MKGLGLLQGGIGRAWVWGGFKAAMLAAKKSAYGAEGFEEGLTRICLTDSPDGWCLGFISKLVQGFSRRGDSRILQPMHDLLALSREIKGIAEVGLRYGDSIYDQKRYERLHEIASELLQSQLPDFRWPVELGYPTPKLDARAAVIHQGKILLVKETTNHLWTLPGGWTDAGDTPSENAVRETFEESGYRVEATKLIAIWDKARHGHPSEPEYTYKAIFACTLLGGEPTLSHETEAIDWFLPDELPNMCPHRASPEYVDLAFRHHADPSLPTEFD